MKACRFRLFRKVSDVVFVTRDGLILSDCDLRVLQSLRRKRLIKSRNGAPYIISMRGRRMVRAQYDNQGI
ncbi:YjhX family toxin [Breoghania sp.]|uniref:YjhX family toxin n=1 Tax=Breoghania sp. TaxID=2065378 RepID=UPI0026033E4A|nr:YjhX family toxin [Breoghania sp.]MDJ0931924.1 YjhX family toxin [Breoghania sp.]